MNKLKEIMKYKKLDTVLLFNSFERSDPNFVYVTNVSNVSGVFVLKDKPVLYASPLEIGIAKSKSFVPVKIINKKFWNSFNRLNIGVNMDYVTVNYLKFLKKKIKCKFVDISKELERLRLIKEKNEVELLREAARIGGIVMKKAFDFCSVCKTELELKNEIVYYMNKLNVEESFPTIVASGRNSGNPHHIPSKNKLRGITVIDLGVKYMNYVSDLTRTICIGKPSVKEKEVYDKVLKVQEDSIFNIIEGKKMYTLQENALRVLGRNFVHGLGHGIGISVHEKPTFSKKDDYVFKKGMVFTVEPGWYFKKFGVRIEDDLYLGNKLEILTKVNKNLIVI